MQAVASAGRDRGFRGWRFGMSDPESVESAKARAAGAKAREIDAHRRPTRSMKISSADRSSCASPLCKYSPAPRRERQEAKLACLTDTEPSLCAICHAVPHSILRICQPKQVTALIRSVLR